MRLSRRTGGDVDRGGARRGRRVDGTGLARQ
jgi:hypothetical protein